MASAVAKADIPRGQYAPATLWEKMRNKKRGYDCAPLGCSDTIRVLHLEMVRWLECADWKETEEATRME